MVSLTWSGQSTLFRLRTMCWSSSQQLNTQLWTALARAGGGCLMKPSGPYRQQWVPPATKLKTYHHPVHREQVWLTVSYIATTLLLLNLRVNYWPDPPLQYLGINLTGKAEECDPLLVETRPLVSPPCLPIPKALSLMSAQYCRGTSTRTALHHLEQWGTTYMSDPFVLISLCLSGGNCFSASLSYKKIVHMHLKFNIKKWAYLLSTEINSLREGLNSLLFARGFFYRYEASVSECMPFKIKGARHTYYADSLSYK